MIGPFWCEEKKCWVRFTANTTGFIAEVAAQDPVDETLTLDWQPATEDYWQVQYQEHNQNRVDDSFRLLEGNLYRTAFKKNPISKEINITTFKLNEQPLGFKLKKGNNPFENKSLQPIADIAFEQLPLTPELIKELDAKLKIERASRWVEWKNINQREQLKLEELSTFDPTASKALLNTLIKQLHALTAAQYSSPELYQGALIKAISDKKDAFYQIVNAFGNTVDETGMNPDDSTAAIDAVDINERRTAFAFAVLREELKQLNAAFDLVTPVAPATDDTLNIPAPPTLTRASTGSANAGLIQSTTTTMPPANPRVPLNSTAPEQPAPVSIHGVPVNVDSNEPEPFVNPRPIPAAPIIKPVVTTTPDNTPDSIPAPPTTHVDAVTNAVNKYKEWYKLGTPHRGANGWFSWLRHGEEGQNRADLFLEKIINCSTVAEAEEAINNYLTQPDTRYHRHSFSSFILDELKKEELQPWASLTLDPQGFYDQQEIIEVLEGQGLPPIP